MEQDLSILIADLSGYTALTETHGALSAADLIDSYVEIVNNSLVGDSYLHQSIGDEVVVISNTPDHLLATAIMLLQNSMKRYNFLQVHGALHYGKIVNRNNNLFGSAINLTSRIAAKATANSMWCSEEFLNYLSDKSLYNFQSKGKHRFKNVIEEREVFEVVIEKPESLHIDPICRMIVNHEDGFIAHPVEPNLFFCSQFCLETYLKQIPNEVQVKI
jgi:adenylate cyclase